MNDHLDPLDADAEDSHSADAGEFADAEMEGAAEAEEEEYGNGAMRRSVPSAPPALSESIERLDALLAAADDEEKIKAGMGIRLALGMAQELKSGKPLGAETTALVAGWVKTYGEDVVETAVKVAREFLVKPEDMRKVLGQRLGVGDSE
ncbi:MAG: hypothetical protein ABIW76_00880 [Fibrobacteria bacterium]